MWKLATLKSNWEALDGRESTVTVHRCSAANLYKSQGTKKKKKKKSNSSQEGKMVLTLGCTIQALSYLSVASPGFYCLLPAWLAASGCYCMEFFSFLCVCVPVCLHDNTQKAVQTICVFVLLMKQTKKAAGHIKLYKWGQSRASQH